MCMMWLLVYVMPTTNLHSRRPFPQQGASKMEHTALAVASRAWSGLGPHTPCSNGCRQQAAQLVLGSPSTPRTHAFQCPIHQRHQLLSRGCQHQVSCCSMALGSSSRPRQHTCPCCQPSELSSTSASKQVWQLSSALARPPPAPRQRAHGYCSISHLQRLPALRCENTSTWHERAHKAARHSTAQHSTRPARASCPASAGRQHQVVLCRHVRHVLTDVHQQQALLLRCTEEQVLSWAGHQREAPVKVLLLLLLLLQLVGDASRELVVLRQVCRDCGGEAARLHAAAVLGVLDDR